jgi:hypothetical protein
MTLKEISTALNTSIVPAIMGADYTVNPDLSNIVDLGTAISAMSADQFKSYFNDFAAAVKTYVDSKGYSPEALPLFVDSQEYGGILQSIKSDFVESRGSNLYSLVDGQYYNDVNKYFGTKFDNKIFEKDVTYSYAKSIPNTMYKKAFLTADGVAQLVANIETMLENSIRRDSSALEHNLLGALALNGKQINLVTSYNNMLATGNIAQAVTTGTIGADDVALDTDKMIAVTSENCIYNKYFMQWAAETISNIASAARFANKKYNDGTISTWQSKEDSVLILNSIYRNRNRVFGIADTDGVSVYDTPFWNAQTDGLIPTVANSTHVIYTEDAQESGNKSLDYVVGLYYDRRAVGYTTTPIPPRTSYNADGDFYNHFRDFNARYWIDTRNTAIVFTLL